MADKIRPCLWFDTEAEEAAKFYTSLFKNSKITSVSHYTEGMPRPAGTVLLVEFTIDGREFQALNGGPEFKFDEAISLSVSCKDQAEIDELWTKLTAGGEESVCGWLKDKYGLSWQIVPEELGKWMDGGDPEATKRVMEEVMKMVKPEIAKLEAAYKGEPVGKR